MSVVAMREGLPEECTAMRGMFSSYLDGAVNGREMQAIAAHLDGCGGCELEFAGWRAMQETLATLKTNRAPVDLGLRLRLAISREQARKSWKDSVALVWENTLRPVALQASAGLACAITLVGTIVFLLGVVPPTSAVLANDEPLAAITAPHYLYSAVRPGPIVLKDEGPAVSTIVIEASINSDGRVYDYAIVSAPRGVDAPWVRNQIAEQMLLSVFKPASVFGVAVRGRAIVTFEGVSVKG